MAIHPDILNHSDNRIVGKHRYIAPAAVSDEGDTPPDETD